jgi:outer membrane scaffolding protein for murein synthesis (MipA/OmpV family)
LGLLGLLANLTLIPVKASESTYAATGLPLWELGIGAALYHQPNYPGSDVQTTTAFPFPYVIYRGDWFRVDHSLQGILYETQEAKIDFSAGATIGWMFWQSKRRITPKNTSPGGEFETPLFGL